jgi:hypothetical protein
LIGRAVTGAARTMGGMDEQLMQRRRFWQALTDQEKELRLTELRRRQQAQIEIELRLLDFR